MDEKTIARFWSKVDRAGPTPPHIPGIGPCWLWTGVLANGYGRLNLYANGDRTAVLYAHRIMWQLTRGAIPARLCVLHKCDTPRCVRPEHLFLGTRPENSRDMVAKGRSTKGRPGPWCGKGHPLAKLDADSVRAIRTLSAVGRTLLSIAHEHGVSKRTVLNVVHGRIWRHVE